MMSIYYDRINRVRAAMTQREIDGFLVLVGENRRYLSGFTAEDHQFDESCGALLITSEGLLLATDSRFDIQARQETQGFEVYIYRKAFSDELPDLVKRLGVHRMGFESERMSVHQLGKFEDAFKKTECDTVFVPTHDLVESLRIQKDSNEIEATAEALELAESVWEAFVYTIRPGMTEKAAAWEFEKRLREAGADSLSFPTIVAGGPNAALPHAVPTDRPFQKGETILFDWGVRLNGYCSDTSRTVVIGSPDERFTAVYETVRKAQELAMMEIRAGMTGKDVDHMARNYIDSTEFKGLFGHGLGHGTGLMIHEPPRLSPLSPHTLEEGMICTVEPGIYIEGWGGVRIENQVVVEKAGPRILNRLNTRLFTIEER
jgi:Xaa-Pro aminopeptidase